MRLRQQWEKGLLSKPLAVLVSEIVEDMIDSPLEAKQLARELRYFGEFSIQNVRLKQQFKQLLQHYDGTSRPQTRQSSALQDQLSQLKEQRFEQQIVELQQEITLWTERKALLEQLLKEADVLRRESLNA